MRKTISLIIVTYFVVGVLFNNYMSCQNYREKGAVKWLFFDDLFGIRGMFWPYYLFLIDNDTIVEGSEEEYDTFTPYDLSDYEDNDYMMIWHFIGGATTTQDSVFYDQFYQYKTELSLYSQKERDHLEYFCKVIIKFNKTFSLDICSFLSTYIDKGIIKEPTFEESKSLLDTLLDLGLPSELSSVYHTNFINMSNQISELLISAEKSNDISGVSAFLDIIELQKTYNSIAMNNAAKVLFSDLE